MQKSTPVPSKEVPDTAASAKSSTTADERLWILAKADTLLEEVAIAMWLAVASIWRIPLALSKPDSLGRIESEVAGGRILPPRINMLCAALASALVLSYELSDRVTYADLEDTLNTLVSVTPEALITVAAPALVALWSTTALIAALLRFLVGEEVQDPQSYLTQAVSSIAIVCCICLAVSEVTFKFQPIWLLNGTLYGLPVLAILWLALCGWNCGRQLAGAGILAPRRWAILAVCPVAFLATAIGFLFGANWLVYVQGALREWTIRGEHPNWIVVRAPTCFVAKAQLICQGLMTTKSDVAVGATKALKISWTNLEGKIVKYPFYSTDSVQPLTVRTPRVELGSYWTLRATDPVPFSLAISKSDACRLYEGFQSYSRQAAPSNRSKEVALEISVMWHPGFGVLSRNAEITSPMAIFHVNGEVMERELLKLCGKSQ